MQFGSIPGGTTKLRSKIMKVAEFQTFSDFLFCLRQRKIYNLVVGNCLFFSSYVNFLPILAFFHFKQLLRKNILYAENGKRVIEKILILVLKT